MISVIVEDGEMQVIEGSTGRPIDVGLHVDAATFIDVGNGAPSGTRCDAPREVATRGSGAARRRYASIIRPLMLTRPGALTSRPPRRVDRYPFTGQAVRRRASVKTTPA